MPLLFFPTHVITTHISAENGWQDQPLPNSVLGIVFCLLPDHSALAFPDGLHIVLTNVILTNDHDWQYHCLAGSVERHGHVKPAPDLK